MRKHWGLAATALFIVAIAMAAPVILEAPSMCESAATGWYTPLGEVRAFDVSAGGFLSDTRCTIKTENVTVSASGSVCTGLRSGENLYEWSDGRYVAFSDAELRRCAAEVDR